MKTLKLPDGLVVSCNHQREARVMWQEIFQDRVYLKHDLTIERGNCVVDVGANIGMFSLWANQQASDLRLHALEPIPETFSVLQANLSRLSNVVLHQTALGGEVGKITMLYFPRASVLSIDSSEKARNYETVRQWLAETSQYTSLRWLARHSGLYSSVLRLLIGKPKERICSVTTLSALMREQSITTIDLLKIDVEGAETKVLDAITPAEWPRIRQVTLETDLSRLPGIRTLLEAQGFLVADEQPRLMDSLPMRQVYARRA